jgi:hypothetical protein
MGLAKMQNYHAIRFVSKPIVIVACYIELVNLLILILHHAHPGFVVRSHILLLRKDY